MPIESWQDFFAGEYFGLKVPISNYIFWGISWKIQEMLEGRTLILFYK